MNRALVAHSTAAVLGTTLLYQGLCGAAEATRGASGVAETVQPETYPSYWAEGEPRLFLAGRGVAGLGYGRAAVSSGYGQPYWKWIGLDAAGILTLDSVSVQSGVRGSLIIADAYFTLRKTYSFSHRAVGGVTSVSSDALERHGAPGAEYTAIDADLWGCIPYGLWLATWEVAWVRPVTLGHKELVLDEIQRVVMGPKGVVSGKLGLNVASSARKKTYVGAMAEYLRLFGRADGNVYRIGPAFWWGLTDHLELGGYLTWPVHSPDTLGFMTGMYGSLGLQYQIASGEPRRQFP